MPKPTPWADVVTDTPELFGVAHEGSTLVIAAGHPHTSISRLHPPSLRIEQQAPGSSSVVVEPYRLNVERWTGSGFPVIQAHPFLLLHLLAAAQVDRSELVRHMMAVGTMEARVARLPIEQPCALLRQLNVRFAALRIVTNCSLLILPGSN